MYKIRDFIDKEVFLVNGKRIGLVSGLLVDFSSMKVETLVINRFGFLRNKYVLCEDIISISRYIIVSSLSTAKGISISNVLMKNVYSKNGMLRGNVSDVLIDEQSLGFAGIICYRGIRNKIKQGDIIIPVNETILGKDYILDKGNGHITFNSIIHKAEEDMLNGNS